MSLQTSRRDFLKAATVASAVAATVTVVPVGKTARVNFLSGKLTIFIVGSGSPGTGDFLLSNHCYLCI